MLQFTPTSEGTTALNNATAGLSPVLIDAIILHLANAQDKTISEFSGSLYKDDCGIGEYCKICFEDTANTSYTITSFTLKSGGTDIANSESVSVVKEANKTLKLEISCQFTGASKCGFNTYEIALPHATNFREGVVRLARSTGETHKDYTVYNATVVDEKIAEISGVVTDDLVPWKQSSGNPVTGTVQLDSLEIVDDYTTPTQTVTIEVTGSASGNVSSISVDGYIKGTAVASSPSYGSSTIAASAIADTDKLVNGSYIAALYSNAVDTASTETAAARKLVTSHAVRDYVENKISTLDAGLVHLAGAETITGAKTFTGGIVANSTISGTGVYSTYSASTWANTSNNSKLPTLGTVRSALSDLETAITTAYTAVDNDLQSQIDAINAGQNLADIVDLIGDLKSHSVANLQPREGSDTVGDKIQVLHDKTDSSGTVVPAADGVATVYELVHGTIDRTTYPKDQPSDTSGYYWHYIGEYGNDSYSKSESDGLYVAKASLDQSFSASSSTTNAPSTKAVYDALDDLADDVEAAYVKLVSATSQTIASPLVIKETTSSANTLSIPDGSNLTASSTLNITAGSSTTLSKVVLDATNGFYTVYLGGTSTKAFTLEKVTGATTKRDVYGDYVANYRDVTNGTLTDGRLVTVDYLNAFTGDMAAYAKLAANNTFTGTTNTFKGVSATSYTGTGVYSTYDSTSWGTATTKIPTVSAVKSAIKDAQDAVLDTISDVDAVGSIGLFVYNEVGAEKAIGATVSGSYLKPVGLSLPMSGQISYKAVAPAMSGTWKLLSAAFKRTATEPCLVMAQKISDT